MIYIYHMYKYAQLYSCTCTDGGVDHLLCCSPDLLRLHSIPYLAHPSILRFSIRMTHVSDGKWAETSGRPVSFQVRNVSDVMCGGLKLVMLVLPKSLQIIQLVWMVAKSCTS